MALNSLVFISIALPLIIFLNLIVPRRFSSLFLLLISIVMYAWVEPKYLVLLLILCCINYCFAIYLDKQEEDRKKVMVEIAVINVGLMVYFKYYGGFLEHLFLLISFPISFHPLLAPLGFSFFMFQMLSYLFDVYYHKVKASHHFIDFALYVMFFPKLIMGPITPYSLFSEQLHHVHMNQHQFTLGVKRFIIGLSEKIILASVFSGMMDQIIIDSIIDHWLVLLAYTLYIYFDFAGYSHMAIGISHMLGFKLVENFNYPYISKSITEFWRRWHISLGMWFRDYVYIPLGGNRVAFPRQIFNLAVVWALTGMWHGTTFQFLLWGFYFFVLIVLEKWVIKDLKKKIPAIINWFVTTILIMLGWAIFRSTNMHECFNFIQGLFTGSLISAATGWYIQNYGLYLLVGVICSLPTLSLVKKIIHKTSPKLYTGLEVVCLTGVFIISMAFLANGGYQTFIYTAF